MFPYPSGAGLHVGHPEGYTATDILARYRRALGFNVLHPMGWDAFGLPAEQYAIRTGQHPRKTTEANIAIFKRQIKSLGFSYDWSREIDTTDPRYFKWTQWIFLKLYNSWFNPAERDKAEPIETLPDPPEIQGNGSGIVSSDPPPAEAYETPTLYRDSQAAGLRDRRARSGGASNWAPSWPTRKSWTARARSAAFPVTRKPMRQWMLRITAYAERLLAGPGARLNGAIRSRKCSATGLGARKGRKLGSPSSAMRANQRLRRLTSTPSS